MAMQETGEVSNVEHLAAESDFRGVRALPLFAPSGAFRRPSTPFGVLLNNVSSTKSDFGLQSINHLPH